MSQKGDIRVRFLLKPVWESSFLSSFSFWYPKHWASFVVQMVKNLPTMHETQIKKIPMRRGWKPTPVLLSGELHGLEFWRATVHGVTNSQTQLSDSHTHTHTHTYTHPKLSLAYGSKHRQT